MHQSQLGAKFALQEKRALLAVELYKLRQLDHVGSGLEGDVLIPGRVTRGLEIEYTGRVSRSLELSLGLDFVRSRDTGFAYGLDDPVGHTYPRTATGVPSRSLRLLAHYRLPQRWAGNSSVGLGLLAHSSRWITASDAEGIEIQGPVRLPGSALMDLSWTRQFDSLTLTGAVRNVADRRSYGTYGSYYFVPLAPGRSWSLAARTSF